MEEVGSALVCNGSCFNGGICPIIFMGGMTGDMYKQFAVCIAVSIAISAICALTLSPAMCSHFLGKKEHKSEDLSKPEFLIHVDHIIERIKRKTAVVIEDFNKFFAKAEDFYIEYVTYLYMIKKKTIILYVSLFY